MTDRSRRGVSGVQAVAAILVLSVVAAAVVLIMRPDLDRPDEAARVRHPAGFSIVAPLNWINDLRPQRLVDGRITDAIKMIPERVHTKETTFLVQKIGTEPMDDPFPGFVDGTFQNQPARIFDGKRGDQYGYVAIFRRDGIWYSLSLSTPDKPATKIADGYWMAFFDTFRVDSAPPTTRPT